MPSVSGIVPGLVFGAVTVVSPAGQMWCSDGRARSHWLCRCLCGELVTVACNRLRRYGDCRHVVCYGRQIDRHVRAYRQYRYSTSLMIGRTFGRWTVIAWGGLNYDKWLCRCECGTERIVDRHLLNRGMSRSCGCAPKKYAGDGRSKTITYHSWRRMRERCLNPKHAKYMNYGGRGIRICERWMDYSAFLADMGKRPGLEYSIDRIDPDGNYEPGNCRWAIDRDQRINKRNSRYVAWEGRMRSLPELCRERAMDYSTVAARIYVLGWSPEKAIGEPIRAYRSSDDPVVEA